MNIALIYRPDTLFNLKDSRGNQVVMRNEFHSLHRRGFKVDLFAAAFAYDDDSLLREKCIRVPVAKWLTNRLRKYLFDYSARWLTRKYDLLHLDAWKSIRPFDARRSLVHIHGTVWPQKMKVSHQRRASKFHHCFVSKFLKSHYLRKYSFLQEDQCHLLHNGVDTDLFKPQDVQREDVFTFGYASRWHPLKGFWVLLEAIRKLEANRHDFKVLLAGGSAGGKEEMTPDKELQILGKMKPYTDSMKTLEILGPVPHRKLPLFYNRLDALLVPSVLEEPFGLVVVEALACGRPVIASRVGGIPEIVNSSVGDLVEPNSAPALADAMEHWLDHRHEVREKATKARETVLSRYTWEHHTDALLKIYERVLNS